MLSTVNQTSWIICISTILSIITNVTLAICDGGRLIIIDCCDNFYQINIDKKTITGPFGMKGEFPYHVMALEYDCTNPNQIMYASNGSGINELHQIDYESGQTIASVEFVSK
eukprot:194696_1